MFRPLVIIALLVASAWTLTEAPDRRPHDGEYRLASDTLLADSVRAGEVLILSLPEHISGRAVESYGSIRTPATGWLQERSLFWRVPKTLTGVHRFAFAATMKGGATDTVHVEIHVGPGDP